MISEANIDCWELGNVYLYTYYILGTGFFNLNPMKFRPQLRGRLLCTMECSTSLLSMTHHLNKQKLNYRMSLAYVNANYRWLFMMHISYHQHHHLKVQLFCPHPHSFSSSTWLLCISYWFLLRHTHSPETTGISSFQILLFYFPLACLSQTQNFPCFCS